MTDIYFRTDGNSEIATGHLMRCLAIARACARMGAAVAFIVSDEESLSLLRERFAVPQEFQVCSLHTDFKNPEQEIPALLSCPFFCRADNAVGAPENVLRCNTVDADAPAVPDVFHVRPWLFIDSYYATPAYFQALRSCFRVAYLDDLRSIDCAVDLLINYDTEEPCACYDHAARRLLGPRCTPLRRQFVNVCYEVRPTAGDVLFSTGGTDPYRIAETLLTILYPEYGPADCGSAAGSLSLLRERFYAMQPARFKSESLPLLRSLHYHVLTSRSNTRYEALQALAQVCPSIHIHTDVKEVAALMASCDLAVSAGGTTLCELCAVGVPSVSYLMAENQRTVVESYEKKQLIPCAGDIRSTDRSEIPADSVSCCVHNSAANVSAHPDRENAVLPDLHTIGRILGFLADMTQNAAARAAVSAAMRNFLDGSGADRIAAALIQ